MFFVNNNILIVSTRLIDENTSMAVNCCWRSEVKYDYLTTVQQSPAVFLLEYFFILLLQVWAQTCLGTTYTFLPRHDCDHTIMICQVTKASGYKRFWAQTCVGANVCGHKRVWAQTCLGTNVCVHKRVWAQSCGPKYAYGHKRVVTFTDYLMKNPNPRIYLYHLKDSSDIES